MILRVLLRSKIHRAFITECNEDYIGSILIDGELMERVDLWEYEKVLICDITNGNRFETYAIAGDRGSGVMSVQGAAAKLVDKGDCIIVMSFDVSEDPIDPKMILVNEDNEFVEYLGIENYAEQMR